MNVCSHGQPRPDDDVGYMSSRVFSPALPLRTPLGGVQLSAQDFSTGIGFATEIEAAASKETKGWYQPLSLELGERLCYAPSWAEGFL